MDLQTAERKRAKIKMALQGPSGSGKTFSALLIAYGLCNDWTKIAVIDSENGSANLYAHFGKYKVVDVHAPFTPEKYIDAIIACEKAAMEVIIIDSISQEWESLLETHSNMQGNSYTAWGKITPRHNAFVQHILQSPAHVIGTIRSKQDYVLAEKNGKLVPEKVGLKGITREGLDYEFTLVFEIDMKHNCNATKDRTSIFTGKPEFVITTEIGKRILAWCNEPDNEEAERFDKKMFVKINACKTVDELIELFKANPSVQQSMLSVFARKRNLLMVKNDTKTILNDQKTSTNGITTNHK